MQPSDFLPPSAKAPVPLASGLPLRRMLVLRRVTRASATVCPLEMGYRLSVMPVYCPRSVQDLPGYGSVPSMRAEVIHHARCVLTLPIFFSARTLPPSGLLAPWAPGNNRFRGRTPAAHMLVDLRITRTVTRHGARSYFRPAGLKLWSSGVRTHWTALRISEGIASSFPFGPTWPGRF